MKKTVNYRSRQVLSLALALSALALPVSVGAQSDNFDSGTLSSSWQLYDLDPGLASFTFPTVGTGKGLRIQALPYADVGFPAAAAIGQTNLYTDFYMALDIVNWVLEDQAAVLTAHWTPAGAASLAEATGMIFNYDACQDGDGTGDRNGGELQINTIAPGFSAGTLAACEMTLVPGHSYRFIFKCTGTQYTGQVYDLADLTAPLATLKVDDSTYPSGQCGFLSFSRNGVVGTTDVTIDNYYAGATDPNPAAAPALVHPISGTPVVETRVPAARWQNFHNPALGISFTAKTHTADVIKASATKLLLNGIDFSSQLTLSADGSTVTGSLPGSALKSNSVYSAELYLADTTGIKTSVNTFWFDTFSESYLNATGIKVIECEDYNYSNGVYQLDPIPVSGAPTNGASQVNGDGVGYYDFNDGIWSTTGTQGVDYFTAEGHNNNWTDYRYNDNIMTGEGIRQEIEDRANFLDSFPPWDPNTAASTYNRPNDNTRQKYAVSNLVEYLVVRTHAGDWVNYTRAFAPTNYYAFLRVGSFYGANLSLSQVTSDPTVTNQTTVDLGTFTVPNQVRKSNFSYVPLLDSNGLASILTLGGTNTLRLTKNGTVKKDDRTEVLNYLLLVPASVVLQSSASAGSAFADDATAEVNLSTRTITIPVTGSSRFFRLNSLMPLKVTLVSASAGTITLKF